MSELPNSSSIRFDPFDLQEAMPNLLRWLADPDVQPWYDEGEVTPENLSERFAGEPAVRQYTITIEGEPAGYLQVYRLDHSPEYQRQVDVDPEAVAMDLFIGDPERRNRGWGSEVIRACLDRIVFGEMDAKLAMIAPDPKNARAVRSYEKVGFRQVKTVYVEDELPGNTGYELIMLLPREEWAARAGLRLRAEPPWALGARTASPGQRQDQARGSRDQYH